MTSIVDLPLSSQDALPVCLCPWLENPYGLVSLLDFMKSFEAHKLLSKVRSLHNQAGLIFESKQGPEYRLAAIDGFRETLEELRDLCEELELPMSALHFSQLLEATSGPARQRLDSNGAERIATMLSVTTENELSLRRLFAVSPERSKFYFETGQNPFGNVVESAFPSVAFDAVEAGRCLALGRFTASVFHLMRVLEVGLCVMAARFGVPSDHTNWHNIIEGIEKAIRDISNDPSRPSDWKDQQEFFSQAASHFMVVKHAWRNYTAHVRANTGGKYTDEEAETIMINVRGFMQKLATRLHE